MRAVKALQRAGFVIVRQSGHIVMVKGSIELIVPRNNPVNAFTMFNIVKTAQLTVEEFKELL